MAASRTILLTNIWLARPGGTQVVVRDLALGFMRRGHRSMVYAPTLGPFAEDLRSRSVTVVDDLRQLDEVPDIIHANHAIPCGEALVHFPSTPAIQMCHSAVHWVEAPIHFPQIGAYIAVDEACFDRLIDREGISPDKVLLLHNAVDLLRVQPRLRPLAPRPMRAIAMTKAVWLPQVRSVCRLLDIELEALGTGGDRMAQNPERDLAGVDLVFASARSALEALCCGCAVVVCDIRGLAGLVTTGNFGSLRALNFGLRSLREPVTEERLLQEIARYDPADAARVGECARREADLEKLIDRIELLHEQVLKGGRRPVITDEAHAMAVSRFLYDYLPRRPNDKRWPWLAERQALLDTLRALEAVNSTLQAATSKASTGTGSFSGAGVDALAQAAAEVYLRQAPGGKQKWQSIGPQERGRWRLVARALLNAFRA